MTAALLFYAQSANLAPAAAEFLAAWVARKESKTAMIRLSGMLQDLEGYVDNTLNFSVF